MRKSAHEFLINTVKSKHQEAEKNLQNFLMAMFTTNTSGRDDALEAAITSLEDLRRVVLEDFRPPWLNGILKNLEMYRQNRTTNTGISALLSLVYKQMPSMQNFEWSFDQDKIEAFDIDQIFEEARSSNRIPELFDEIISCLQEISNSGAIDSIRILSELDSLIESLKRSKNSSYLATQMSWLFLITWLKNTGWELLGEIPLVGAPVRALKETVSETSEAIDKMHQDIDRITADEIFPELPKLSYRKQIIDVQERPQVELLKE